jgi:hypothetical protein
VPYGDKKEPEERWVVWLAFSSEKQRRAWTLKPPGNREWFKSEGTIHEIVQTVCGIANGRGGTVLDELR